MARRKTRKTRTKQLLAEGDSVTLPKAQQRAVTALVTQREQIRSAAGQALVEIGEALTELATLFAITARLPEGAYDFETRGQAIVLVRRQDKETEAKKPDSR